MQILQKGSKRGVPHTKHSRGFATVTKVHLAACGIQLPTEDLASSTMDAQQFSQEHMRLAYYFQKHRPPSSFACTGCFCKDLTNTSWDIKDSSS